MPKLFIHALGCKTNHYESQALAQQLSRHNFSLVSRVEEADVGILNTCTVTAEASRKSRQYLRRMKRKNPKIFLVAMGCYAQLEDISSACDLAIGTSRRGSILGLIATELDKRQANHDFNIELPDDLRALNQDNFDLSQSSLGQASRETEYEELGIVSDQIDTRAQIKIQDGCNAFCSFCAIPLARGRLRSRSRKNIIKEAEMLAQKGHKEVVLTGIHICSFEKEQGRNSDALAELCLELNRIKGLARIRLGSLEPLSISKSFIQILRQADKVCPHFHLSLQSGSDTVLRRMRRRYLTEQYRRRVQFLREVYDEPAISTDLMVGFPEETDQEFQESLDFVKEMELSRVHVFPYSVRPGTLAAQMTQVPAQVIKDRAETMLVLADKLAEKYACKFIGKKQEVLFEDEEGGCKRGYTDRYVRVYADKLDIQTGEIKELLIIGQEKGDLRGQIVC